MLENNIKLQVGDDPIFLGGYPKSGTTLLCALLDEHPDLLVFPEETRYLGRTYCLIEDGDFQEEFSRYINSFQIFGKESLWSSGYRDYRHIDNNVFRDAVLKQCK